MLLYIQIYISISIQIYMYACVNVFVQIQRIRERGMEETVTKSSWAPPMSHGQVNLHDLCFCWSPAYLNVSETSQLIVSGNSPGTNSRLSDVSSRLETCWGQEDPTHENLTARSGPKILVVALWPSQN